VCKNWFKILNHLSKNQKTASRRGGIFDSHCIWPSSQYCWPMMLCCQLQYIWFLTDEAPHSWCWAMKRKHICQNVVKIQQNSPLPIPDEKLTSFCPADLQSSHWMISSTFDVHHAAYKYGVWWWSSFSTVEWVSSTRIKHFRNVNESKLHITLLFS